MAYKYIQPLGGIQQPDYYAQANQQQEQDSQQGFSNLKKLLDQRRADTAAQEASLAASPGATPGMGAYQAPVGQTPFTTGGGNVGMMATTGGTGAGMGGLGATAGMGSYAAPVGSTAFTTGGGSAGMMATSGGAGGAGAGGSGASAGGGLAAAGPWAALAAAIIANEYNAGKTGDRREGSNLVKDYATADVLRQDVEGRFAKYTGGEGSSGTAFASALASPAYADPREQWKAHEKLFKKIFG